MINYILGILFIVLVLAASLGVGFLVFVSLSWIAMHASWIIYGAIYLLVMHIVTLEVGGLPAILRSPYNIGKWIRERK